MCISCSTVAGSMLPNVDGLSLLPCVALDKAALSESALRFDRLVGGTTSESLAASSGCVNR